MGFQKFRILYNSKGTLTGIPPTHFTAGDCDSGNIVFPESSFPLSAFGKSETVPETNSLKTDLWAAGALQLDREVTGPHADPRTSPEWHKEEQRS